MKKALLIGNGFTMNLIEHYKDSMMMKELYHRIPLLVDRLENEFHVFRNPTFIKSDIIHYKNTVKPWIIDNLIKLKFENPETIYTYYFQDCGLVYSIVEDRLKGIETYLKVASLFMSISRFDDKEYDKITRVANEIYYNNGKNGKDSINNQNIDIDKMGYMLEEFDDIYTTNYDTILDDFLEPIDKFPYHLHGGFSINHLNKDPDGRYNAEEARLIWGTCGKEKNEALKVSIDFNDLNFDAWRFDHSGLYDYLDYLENGKYDQIHIFGFSGENDNHINQRIIDNQTIKEIIFYVDPVDLHNIETQERSRLLFGGEKKLVNLRSWYDFWDRVKKDC